MRRKGFWKYGVYGVVFVWGMAWLLFFLLKYQYHFFYQEQNQLFLLSREYLLTGMLSTGWLSRQVGDSLTQFYYYIGAGPVILTGCLLVLGDLLRRLFQQWGLRSQWWSTLLALAVATVFAVFSLHHGYKLSNIIAAIGMAGLLFVAMLVAGKKRWRQVLASVLAAIVGYVVFGLPQWGKLQKPNFYLEKQLAADNEYYFGNYQKLFAMVENDPEPTPEMTFFYNLARAERGELPDYLLRFSNTDLGTFHKIGPETPRLVINNMNELYWVLGDMTFCERAAMMNNVFSADNRNVRMMKRLAECSLVSRDTLAAQKYLRLLSKTMVYGPWARRTMKQAEPRYVQKQAFVPQRDTINVTDNAHFIMVQLLDHNPANIAALDYMLCSDLLLKDMDSFKRDYDRYCAQHPRVKKLYQEALCIWLAGTQATEEQWKQYISMPDVARRFAQYNQQRGNPQFSDTYWYYFDKAKPPKWE